MPRMTQAEVNAYLRSKFGQEALKPKSNGSDDEGKLHDEIYAFLRKLGVRAIVHSRMDRATTTALGVPDFIFCYQSQPYAIEAKSATGKPTPEQSGWLMAMQLDGWITGIVRSVEDVMTLMGL